MEPKTEPTPVLTPDQDEIDALEDMRVRDISNPSLVQTPTEPVGIIDMPAPYVEEPAPREGALITEVPGITPEVKAEKENPYRIGMIVSARNSQASGGGISGGWKIIAHTEKRLASGQILPAVQVQKLRETYMENGVKMNRYGEKTISIQELKEIEEELKTPESPKVAAVKMPMGHSAVDSAGVREPISKVDRIKKIVEGLSMSDIKALEGFAELNARLATGQKAAEPIEDDPNFWLGQMTDKASDSRGQYSELYAALYRPDSIAKPKGESADQATPAVDAAVESQVLTPAQEVAKIDDIRIKRAIQDYSTLMFNADMNERANGYNRDVEDYRRRADDQIKYLPTAMKELAKSLYKSEKQS